MRTFLSFRILNLVLLVATFLFSTSTMCQQWTLANAYGGSVGGFIDGARAVCTDASGNVYVTGTFNETINFGNGTATLTAIAVGTHTDGFVAKFNSSGLCQWSMRFGGAAADAGGLGIVTNGTAVYVTGGVGPTANVAGTAITNVGGSSDGVVFSLNATSGALNWAETFGGGPAGDAGFAICLDASGNVYLSGKFTTRTTDANQAYFGAIGAFQRSVLGNGSTATFDLFVARVDPSTGIFQWVSTGGADQSLAGVNIANDNVTGCGICFAPSVNELVVAGSFANANATYFSNGSATPAFSLTNNGSADMCVIELDLSGNFISGVAAGGTTNDEALAITYDALTQATYIAGYFNSATVSGALSLTNSAGGFDDIFYARYNPTTNTFPWAKNASGSAGGNDAAFAIASNGNGGIFVGGRLQSTTSFPTATTPLQSTSSGADDIFLVKINATNGNAITIADADGATGTDLIQGIAMGTGGNLWAVGIVAGGTQTYVPSSPTVSITTALDQEMFVARYNDPSPLIGTQPSASTACTGLAVSFSVGSITGGSGFTFQWQESSDAVFTSPTTLTNTGIYSTTTTTTLNISDNSNVNGKYYRAIVTNSAGNSTTSNGALLTATTPTLPTGNLTLTQAVNTSNNLFYGPSCAIIAKVVPSGGTPVSGNITCQTWVEAAVPTFGGQPFVQRHYQVTPTGGSTGTVTLYFSQTDFDNFNADPGSTLNLPTGPADATGKANLRLSKFTGSSNDGTGLPGSYTGAGSLIDPVDANIIWNATFSRWEVSFAVTGFSGFFVQTALTVLPVNLISFAAQRNDNNILLKWQTAGETNNNYFELQRSSDGRTFAPLTQVTGVNGSGSKDYSWNDAGIASLGGAKVYYRLRIVSLSGLEEYSNIIVVYLQKAATLITGITPTPFVDKFDVGLNMPRRGGVRIQMTDMNGAILMRKYIQAPIGFSTYRVTGLEKLPSGMYLVSVDLDAERAFMKVVK